MYTAEKRLISSWGLAGEDTSADFYFAWTLQASYVGAKEYKIGIHHCWRTHYNIGCGYKAVNTL